MAGDPVSENAGRYLLFWATTSLGWDIPRGLLTAVLIVVAGPAILAALRRAAQRAAFDAPVGFRPGEPARP